MSAFHSSSVSELSVADRLSLKGKNYLITGGARGIGFAVAKAIARPGGGVAIIDALPEPVEEFHTLSDRFGVKTSYAQGDVTIQSSMEGAFSTSVEAIGQLHGGFLAAGVCIPEALVEATWEVSTKTLDINVMGTFWMTKLLTGHLIETGTPGSIVLVASAMGHGFKVPGVCSTMYNASKAAVKGMVGALAVELGPHDIRVNSISPGFIDTPMTQDFDEHNLNFFRTATPAKRIGSIEDITPLVCYLLSDASPFSTGGDHMVSGGIHAGTTDAWNFRT